MSDGQTDTERMLAYLREIAHDATRMTRDRIAAIDAYLAHEWRVAPPPVSTFSASTPLPLLSSGYWRPIQDEVD